MVRLSEAGALDGRVQVRPSDFVQDILHLNGAPYSIRDYPYLVDIYNTKAREVGLFTARQVSKCGRGDTPVVREDGSLTRLDAVRVGDRVCTVQDRYRPGAQKVIGVYPNGKRPCLRVTTKSGAVLTLTSNHRLLGFAGYKEAGDLRPGDALAIAETAGAFLDLVPEGGEARIILTAYMIGDGCTGCSENWNFTSGCPEVVAEVCRLEQGHTRTRERDGTSAVCVNFRKAAKIRGWCEEDGLAGKHAWEKECPDWVFRLSREDTALFLSRLWATDGCCTRSISYTSTSEILARQVQSLLRKLGIRTTLKRRKTTCKGKRHRDAWTVRVAGYDAMLRFTTVLPDIPGKRFAETEISTERRSTLVTLPPELNQRLRDLYAPISRTPKRVRPNGIHAHGLKWPRDRLSYAKLDRWIGCYEDLGLPTEELEDLRAGNVWWDTVISVEEDGEHEVYDIEVEGDHNFLVDTGVVSHNSTFLASSAVMHAVTEPNGRQVIVSPLQEQAYVFSTERLRDFVHDSPIVKNCFFTGRGVIDQMLRKQFNNGHLISLGYAQRTADRLRGKSARHTKFDEIQDIMPEVLPVVQEMGFRCLDPTFWYCGTPKSLSNHMERMRSRSTGCEWGVRCHNTGCRHWNLRWDESNIGDRGVICATCGRPIDTDRGQWVARRHLDLDKGRESLVTMESYRIPQLIVKPVMDDKWKWIELLKKLRNYPTYQFHNEVLGLPYDSGIQPVTLEQLMSCCLADRHNTLPDPDDPSTPPLVMGIDWAFTAENSYTFIVVGGWNPFPARFEVYYWKCFKGNESDSLYQIQEVVRMFGAHRIKLIGSDWGCGQVQGLQLVNLLGEEQVAQMWHTALKGAGGMGSRAKWDGKGRKWHLARTRVLTDTFESIRQGQVRFPRAEECGELFDHVLAETMEYRPETNRAYYVNVDPDDGLHALTYAMLAGELLLRGDFGGHAGSDATSLGGGRDDDPWNEEPDEILDAMYA